jgi:hypothetical protein
MGVASSAPKRLLPGNGPRGRPLVRYLIQELLAWAATHDTRHALVQDESPADSTRHDGGKVRRESPPRATVTSPVAAALSGGNPDGNSDHDSRQEVRTR